MTINFLMKKLSYKIIKFTNIEITINYFMKKRSYKITKSQQLYQNFHMFLPNSIKIYVGSTI